MEAPRQSCLSEHVPLLLGNIPVLLRVPKPLITKPHANWMLPWQPAALQKAICLLLDLSGDLYLAQAPFSNPVFKI